MNRRRQLERLISDLIDDIDSLYEEAEYCRGKLSEAESELESLEDEVGDGE